MANNTVRIALDQKSWRKFQQKLQGLEKAVRKQTTDAALLAGANVLKDEANRNAPGPYVIAEVASGRTLKKRRKSVGVKTNARVAAIGVDKDHWYYRFAEFGATAHDIKPVDNSALKLSPLGDVFARYARGAGGIREYAFLRRAFNAKGAEAIKVMADRLRIEIEKAAQG